MQQAGSLLPTALLSPLSLDAMKVGIDTLQRFPEKALACGMTMVSLNDKGSFSSLGEGEGTVILTKVVNITPPPPHQYVPGLGDTA